VARGVIPPGAIRLAGRWLRGGGVCGGGAKGFAACPSRYGAYVLLQTNRILSSAQANPETQWPAHPQHQLHIIERHMCAYTLDQT
jgi:hypothetical protein